MEDNITTLFKQLLDSRDDMNEWVKEHDSFLDLPIDVAFSSANAAFSNYRLDTSFRSLTIDCILQRISEVLEQELKN